MKLLLAEVALVLGLATSLFGAEIKVLLNPENQNVLNALIVVFPKTVRVTKGQTALKYKILNRSSEDIFVVITSKNVASCALKGPSSGSQVGGGKLFGNTSRHQSLRLLYAPRRASDGTVSEGEDELAAETIAEVNVAAGPDQDLSDWIGATGSLRLVIGYYVGNSKDFRLVTVPVPIEIQQGEQGGAEQPATRPELRSEDRQKPQPEAEGRSR
jgi:hypothetical protein